ncbi:3'(2'),5'-bisphosphate nucleotidase CysQ [Candidatus Nomurabacteria bacterium]|nr:3'(2'),5'-bisphosphate nucleotidase CysQ [Candidatus Nomurabacteria bacterium]
MNSRIEYFDVVSQALQDAGNAVLHFYEKEYQVHTKDDGSPVTLADKASHNILIEQLCGTQIPVYTEESDSVYPPAETFWCVDPLDGTKDFIHATGDFSILVSLIDRRQPSIGFVYQPTTGDLFFAQRGKGAFARSANGNTVSIHADSQATFAQQKLLVSRFHLQESETKLKDQLALLGFEQKGSCGLKMVAVAQGSAHIYVNSSDKTSEWDTAAGQVILQEAGAALTDIDGNQLIYAKDQTNNPNGIVATSNFDHQKVLESLQICLN